MVEHVRMVSRLIEGRRVSRREVREMLERVVRQHTIVRRRKIDQAVAWIKENPP
jgi:DNA-binding FadR family transcriptional regulator